jgi:transcriptional regulator with XRE-family HTH domain
MTADDFRAWRKLLGMTQVRAAAALSVTERSIKYYESGTHRITPRVAMQCAMIARRRRQGTVHNGMFDGRPKPNDLPTPLHACQRLYEIISPHYRASSIVSTPIAISSLQSNNVMSVRAAYRGGGLIELT